MSGNSSAADSLWQLLHTCLSIFGCSCLDAEFWSSRRTGSETQPPLLHPRPQHQRGDDLLEGLLRTPPGGSRCSLDGGVGLEQQQLQRGGSMGSEDMYRAASFNTRVGQLRSQSPFYRMQDEPGGSGAQQQQAAAAGGRGERPSGIELKPANTNVLLGQQHLESRGKFVPVHPVAHPGAVAVRRGASPLQQQHVAVADEA